MMKKILCVFGTRPEAIKMVPIILRAQQGNDFDLKVCVTGQHRSMLDQTMNLFNIKSDYDLNVMQPNQSLTDITVRILQALPEVYADFKPDRVLVQGDTTTTFAAALAAFYQKIPVAHVEAGLRTGRIDLPWPEEANRKLASVITDLHFAPTEGAKNNLLREAIPAERIFVTGNTVIDTLLLGINKIKNSDVLKNQFGTQFSFLDPRKKLILVTGHRRENFGEGFLHICQALSQLARQNEEQIEIIYPVHLNPQVQQPVHEILSRINNIHLIAPLDYIPFIYLLDRSYLVLTDSGGVQEEAPTLGKPVLVMRSTTERPEAVEAGTAKLVGTVTETIVAATEQLIHDKTAYQAMHHAFNPYGDGCAALKILDRLKDGNRLLEQKTAS